jgi:DNA ligase-associated metallophosphoesterase
MNLVVKEIVCKGEVLTLTNQRVLFWAKEQALILSDLHVGKSATFRKHGIPISRKVLEDDLAKLSALIEHFQAQKLIVVGDLFHAEYNKDISYFKDWLGQNQITIELIAGNHDRHSERFYEELGLKVYSKEKISDVIRFVHDETAPAENYFTISGHTHPGVLIKGKGRQYIKLPCFQVTEHQLILPAFSKFTGLNTNNLPDNCTCYGFTETSIVKI